MAPNSLNDASWVPDSCPVKREAVFLYRKEFQMLLLQRIFAILPMCTIIARIAKLPLLCA